MKKTFFALILCLCVLAGCAPVQTPQATAVTCRDTDDNGICDDCGRSLLVTVDVYSVNDLHGKVADGDNHPGVDELTTFLKQARRDNPNTVLLSAGDMWQGSSESNMTHGLLTTEWMNDAGFDAMTLGNHEYDWGEDPIRDNAQAAQFPLLAINVYDRETDRRAEYCQSSTLVALGKVQVGIIGAIGDCYSSISADKCKDVYFKTGKELTALVKTEAENLRTEGADVIIYVLHDGYGDSKGGSVTRTSNRSLSEYYDASLSEGYVDLVFEGHTHQRYILEDEAGVYHLQNGGDNNGISNAKITVNYVTGSAKVRNPKLVATGNYARLEADPIVATLMEKYEAQIGTARQVVGRNGAVRGRNELRQLGADLYYEKGIAKWGVDHDIVLGGGFFSVRDPGSLAVGEVTYGDLYGLFPFDNDLVLCTIKGKDLKEKFFETNHSSYFISYGKYGEEVRQNLDLNETYYVVVDTYTSLYGPNNLTEVARYDEGVYLRDLLAEYIATGALE